MQCDRFHVILDNELVAKSAPREYFNLMMNLKKHNMSLSDFADKITRVHKQSKPGADLSKVLLMELSIETVESYEKFRRKAQKKLKVKNLKLSSVPMQLAKEKYGGYGAAQNKVYDVIQKEEDNLLRWQKPTWTIDLEVSPHLKKLKAEAIIIVR
jgi:hypothetical protein